MSLGGPYIKIFKQLNKLQSAPYQEFKKYSCWPVEEVVGLFLNNKSWINLLEEGLISKLGKWNRTAVKWAIVELNSNPNVFKLKKSWTDEVFKKKIRCKLKVEKDQKLVGVLKDLGF
jgi:hypothetical protein